MKHLLQSIPQVPSKVILDVHQKPFSSSFRESLFSLTRTLTHETRDAFEAHVDTIELVHVFRDHTREMKGFAMWPLPTRQKDNCVMRGGKLRLRPEIRRMALPHLSNLVALSHFSSSPPFLSCARFFRLSFASVFGYASLRPSLSHCHPLSSHATPNEVLQEAKKFADENGFYLVPHNLALVDVHFCPPQSAIVEAGPSFMQLPATKEYTHFVPGWDKGSTCYLAFWWEYDLANVSSQIKYINARINE